MDDLKEGIDINQLIPVDYMMHTDLFGYLGTLSQPPCTTGVGWYIVPKIFELSETQLEKIKQDTHVPNN